MIVVPVKPQWLEYARSQHFNGQRPVNSEGPYLGTIAELAFGSLLKEAKIPFEYVAMQKKTWDFVINGERLDVKAQVLWSAATPGEDYLSTIIAEQIDYDCDWYVFSMIRWDRVASKPTEVLFTRSMPKEAYRIHPELMFKRKGERVVSLEVKSDCYMLPYRCMPEVEPYLWWHSNSEDILHVREDQ